jgi:DNA-binding transcriptional MocR family regulator
VWVRGPEWLDSVVLAQAASRQGILFEPEAHFRLQDDAVHHDFRLAYSSIAVSAIEAGVERLSKVLTDLKRRQGRIS